MGVGLIGDNRDKRLGKAAIIISQLEFLREYSRDFGGSEEYPTLRKVVTMDPERETTYVNYVFFEGHVLNNRGEDRLRYIFSQR